MAPLAEALTLAEYTHAEVLAAAHRIRVERGDYNIAHVHLADAIEALVASRAQSQRA